MRRRTGHAVFLCKDKMPNLGEIRMITLVSGFVVLALVALVIWVAAVCIRREPVVPLVSVVAVLTAYICLVTVGIVQG